MSERLDWGDDTFRLRFSWAEDAPVRLAGVDAGVVSLTMPAPVNLVEVLTDEGRFRASTRLVDSAVGRRLRHVAHRVSADIVVLEQHDPVSGLTVTAELRRAPGVAALSSVLTVRNEGTATVHLRAVTPWTAALGAPDGGTGTPSAADWVLLTGRSEWMAENRWEEEPLAGALPAISTNRHTPHGAVIRSSRGTHSTDGFLPMGGVRHAASGITWLWQAENSGGWRHEVGENLGDGYVAVSGPTEADHSWGRALAPGQEFESVRASVALGHDLEEAAAQLTRHRRAGRLAHPDDAVPAIVFNDYMNTLLGDPDEEKLVPLIDAVAGLGVDVFCIDAGWYAEDGNWWDTVGAWQPSRSRFPAGFPALLDRIRGHGMVPGVWLEPEVIGVRSPLAETLPADAFFALDGVRIREAGRYHLDLSHPVARRHLDDAVDRLVALGVGYLKLDYNVNPGVGTDARDTSAGDGLLRHNRGHVDWLRGLYERHPDLIIENCGSGALRADPLLLSVLQLQSTSDQEEVLRYPPIAVGAPMSMLPEQAASWAYPQADMTDEEAAFTLVTGLTGRMFLSGHVDRFDERRRALAHDAVDVARTLHADLADSVPVWPTGLPAWDDGALTYARVAPSGTYVYAWNRAEPRPLELALPHLAGRGVDVEVLFPSFGPWESSWDAARGVLTLTPTVAEPSARLLRLRASGERSAATV